MKPDEEEVKRIECRADENAVKIGLNEIVSFEFYRHGSVGENMEFEISDESILKHLRTETEYLYPEKMKYPGWTGGDAEKGKWFFKAVGIGTTTLTVNKIFRGTLENKCAVEIIVK
ncbi:MAG: hypothetical protein AM325_015485 [Candidatus Thorarchaeota archaeon SMTZ1-45]|nr:MAG: hypothetical protein AM325_16685 [Candidatus Thorarchaeota archaeon SMTZ1-45]